MAQSGQSLTEYSLTISLIALLSIVALQILGQSASANLNGVSETLEQVAGSMANQDPSAKQQLSPEAGKPKTAGHRDPSKDLYKIKPQGN